MRLVEQRQASVKATSATVWRASWQAVSCLVRSTPAFSGHGYGLRVCTCQGYRLDKGERTRKWSANQIAELLRYSLFICPSRRSRPAWHRYSYVPATAPAHPISTNLMRPVLAGLLRTMRCAPVRGSQGAVREQSLSEEAPRGGAAYRAP